MSGIPMRLFAAPYKGRRRTRRWPSQSSWAYALQVHAGERHLHNKLDVSSGSSTVAAKCAVNEKATLDLTLTQPRSASAGARLPRDVGRSTCRRADSSSAVSAAQKGGTRQRQSDLDVPDSTSRRSR
jgi:hypothetical protein